MGDTKNNMKINNSTIFLKDIRCYAYHGVAPQENLIGNEYVIDLKLKVDISKAAQTMKWQIQSTTPKYIM